METDDLPRTKNVRLQQFHQQWANSLDTGQSPEEAYKVRLENAKANYQNVSRAYDRGGSVAAGLFNDDSSADSSSDGFEMVVRLMDKYRAVREEKEIVRQKESEYRQKLMEQWTSMFRELLGILGQSVCNPVINDWVANQESSLNAVRGQDRDEIQPANTITDLPFPNALNSTQQPPNAALPIQNSPHVPDEVTYSDPPTHNPQRSTESASLVQDGERETSSQSGSSCVSKQVQGNTSSMPLTKQTIQFEELLQAGNASFKYVIAEYNSRCYILECKRHKKHFRTAKPIQGAWKHLRGRKHYSGKSVTYDMAIAELGTEVLGWTKEKVMENNKKHIITKARTKRNTQNMDVILRAGASHSPSTINACQTRAERIYPQLGEVYKTRWKSVRRFYAVLILPLDTNLNFSHLVSGWDTSLKHTKLLPRPPSCYVQQENGHLEVTDDYKPGGSKESKRKYPVLFFHKNTFPFGCELAWVSVSDLETYDRHDESIEPKHKQQVEEFLSHYGNAGNEAIKGSLYGDNVLSPTYKDANSETFSNRPSSEHHSCPSVEQPEVDKEKSTEPALAEPSNVIDSNCGGLTDVSSNRPPNYHCGDRMDIDIEVDSDNLHTTSTLEERINDKPLGLLHGTSSPATTSRHNYTGQHLYGESMNDGTQSTTICTLAPISPSSAAIQARAALEHVLTGHSPAP